MLSTNTGAHLLVRGPEQRIRAWDSGHLQR